MDNIISDIEKAQFNGLVKKIEVLGYRQVEEFGEIVKYYDSTDIAIFYLNENGHVVGVQAPEAWGVEFSVTEYRLDLYYYNPNNRIDSVMKFTCSKIHEYINGSLYYDGLVFYRNCYLGCGTIYDYKYNNEGKIIDLSKFTIYEDGRRDLTERVRYRYENHKCIEAYYSGLGALKYNVEKIYDSNNHLIKDIVQKPNTKIAITYSYNSNGLMTEKTDGYTT